MLHCAEIEGKLGEASKRFQDKIQSEFVAPLKAFLEIDVKQALVSCVATASNVVLLLPSASAREEGSQHQEAGP